MNCMKNRVTISLDEELIKILDKKRNGIPRSYYINKLLKERLKGGKKD